MRLPCNLAIPLPGIYPDKTVIQKIFCALMFLAALFMKAKTWKQQPECQLRDEWLKKMWCIYAMEY